MEKLKHSLDDNLPGNAHVRMTLVVSGHHKAIIELDSDVAKTNELIFKEAETTENELSKLEKRIEAIENTWYRKLGRRIRRGLRWHFRDRPLKIPKDHI